MDIKTFLLITLWSFIGLLFIAILVLTFLYGRLTVKDNAEKALVFLKTGRHIGKPIKGSMVDKPNQVGARFNYLDKSVFVPHKYGDYFYCNKRMIFVNHIGQLIPMPFSDDKSLSNEEKAELIYELCASHIGADSIKALKGKQTMSLLIVGVIAFVVGILVVFGYNYIQDTIAVNNIQQQQQKPSIEIKPMEVK